MNPQRRLRFLIDVCAASRMLIGMLVGEGHDVLVASEVDPGATDEVVLELAVREQRILVTRDKGFGSLVFAKGMAASGVVWFRGLSAPEQVAALRKLIRNEADAMADGAWIVATPNRVRVSSRPQGGGD